MAAKKRPKPTRGETEAGSFAYDGLDRVLHEKARLSILTALLARPDGILFTDLKGLCTLTDGNLSRHVRVLQEATLVEVWKGHTGRRPQTLIRLSKTGRQQFLDYLEQLEQVIETAKRGADRSDLGFDAPPGWVPA